MRAILQRLIKKILGNLKPRYAVVYIDNVTIFSKTMEQHLVNINNVFNWLAKANLKVNIDKCSFAKEKVLVLRHQVIKESIKINEEKVNLVNIIKLLTTVTGVKGFLGVINFYRRFIPIYSIVADPMIKLNKGKKA